MAFDNFDSDVAEAIEEFMAQVKDPNVDPVDLVSKILWISVEMNPKKDNRIKEVLLEALKKHDPKTYRFYCRISNPILYLN